MNKKGANLPIIILSVLLIVAVILLAFMFYNNKSPETKSTTTNTNSKNTASNNLPSTQNCIENWDCDEWSSCVNNNQIRTCTDLNYCKTTKNKPSEQRYCDVPEPEPEPTQQLTNCGTTGISIDFSQQAIEKENEDNYNCFANKIDSCQKAKMVYEIEIKGLLGVNQKYSHYYELKGDESGKCELYVKTNSYDSFSYTDSTVQHLLDSGMSQEEIDQQEQELFESFQQIVGRDGTCKYSNTVDINAYFDDFAEGDISVSTDEGLPNADECSGTFFEFVETTQ